MNQVEVFDAADLEGIGLVGYLHDGIGIPLADLEPYAEELAAYTGHLLLIRARAFADAGATLTPAAPILFDPASGRDKNKLARKARSPRRAAAPVTACRPQ